MSVKKSIAEQIAELNDPASLADPEDDFNYDTQAKVVHAAVDDDEGNFTLDGNFHSGAIRRQAATLLEERDTRYKGRKTSRKELEEDSDDGHEGEDSSGMSDEDESLEEDSDDDDSNDDITAFRELMKKENLVYQKGDDNKADNDTDEEKDAGEESIDEDSDDGKDIYSGKIWEKFESSAKISKDESEGDDNSESDESDDSDSDNEDETEDEVIKDGEKDNDIVSDEDETSDVEVVSKVDLDEEIQRGQAVKNQQRLWDYFLETRIKLQKAVQLSNQLPQYTTYHNLMQLGDEELTEHSSTGCRNLKKLLKVLIDLQDELLMQNSETRHIVTGEKQKEKEEGSDEEITSEDEDEKKPREEIKKRKSLKRKADLRNPGEELAKRHKYFEKYRNTVLYSWYDKTKLASGKLNSKSFRSFEKSPVEQVEQIMLEKNRLIHRTQMKRSVYKVIGKGDVGNGKEKDGYSDEEKEEIPEVNRSTQLHEIDPEIFDDDDFYHQLLKELIERKTADTTDPAQLTRQWLAVQKLRSKIKRVVDTRASKGRKLRYDVHPKMVSFMAPKDESTMTDDARDELFRSLFGQTNFNEATIR